jgi:double-strand-break repair protein rad21 homolog
MFYHSFILGQRGPLAKIWLAAHYDKKLGKKEVISANIETCVDSIINSRLSLSLRTTSHLLLGVTKLLHKQANYLLKDLEHAAFFLDSKSKSVDLPKPRIQARLKDITLPEMINFDDNFELIPDPPIMNEFKFKSYLDKNKLIEDLDTISFADPLLSVLDCYSTRQPNGDHQFKINLEDLDKPITDDGFGEPYVSNIDQFFEDIPQDQGFEHVYALTQTEREPVASEDVDRLQRSTKVSFDVASDSIQMIQDVNRLKIDDLTRSVSSIEVGRDATSLTELKDQADAISTRKSIEIVRGPSMERQSLTRFKHQQIILEPLEVEVTEQVKKKQKKLAVDARITLNKEQFLKRLHPYNDTIGVLNLAPSTKKMVQLGEQTAIRNLMSQFMRHKISFQLKQVYMTLPVSKCIYYQYFFLIKAFSSSLSYSKGKRC